VAAEIASGMDAELFGIFVEDINLLRLTALPFARELRYPSAIEERLDRGRMERELKVMAEKARRALAAIAAKSHLRWSFQIARGQVAAEILEASLGADLVIVGKMSRPLAVRPRVGSTALALAANAQAVLVVESGSTFRQPVMAIYDGSAAAAKALLAAAGLAKTGEKKLAVLIPAADLNALRLMEEEVADILRALGVEAKFKQLKSADVASVLHAVRMEGCGALVLAGNSRLLQESASRSLLGEVNCPVLLIR
jgi:nucleotide-binding universal stress UspA family protein